LGNPKKKFSRARQAKRAAQWKIHPPGLEPCPHCREPKLPHRVCPNCGRYRGRVAVGTEE